MDQYKRMGRLVFREKCEFWVAYFALDKTMNGALELGRIRMALVERPDRKNQFMDTMREVFGDLCQQELGVRPKCLGPEIAPEHERGV